MVQVLCYIGYFILLSLALLLTLFVSFTGYIFYVQWKYSHIPGPPVENFFLGRLSSIIKENKTGNFDGDQLIEWARKYGSVFQIRLLHSVLLIPSSPLMVKEFLTKGKYPKDKLAYAGLYGAYGSRIMGSGVITNTNHTEWYKRRSALNPAFHKKTLAQMMDKFNEVTEVWIRKLDEHVDGDYFTMLEYLTRATMAAMVKVGLDMDIDVINEEDNPFPQAIRQLFHAVNMVRDPFSKFYPSLREFRQKVRNAATLVRSYGTKCLNRRLDNLNTKDSNPNDVLACILRMKEVVPTLNIEDMLDEFDSLFIASTETTANTLAFTLNVIGQRPDILEKIYEEVDTVLGDKKRVSWEDISKLEYIGMVIKEVLRLYPIAPGTVRHVNDEVTVDGVRIPADSRVYVCFFILHRLEEHFTDALEFKPERWAEGRPQFYTYAPFSMGPRSCLGQQFAQIEMKMLLARFLQRFEFTLDPDQDFEIKDNVTLLPKGGSRMTLRYRKQKAA